MSACRWFGCSERRGVGWKRVREKCLSTMRAAVVLFFFTCRCNSSNVAGKMESVVTWNTNEKAEVPIADEVFPFASFRSFQPQPQTTAEDGLRIAPIVPTLLATTLNSASLVLIARNNSVLALLVKIPPIQHNVKNENVQQQSAQPHQHDAVGVKKTSLRLSTHHKLQRMIARRLESSSARR